MLLLLLLLMMMIWMNLRHIHVSAGGYWQPKVALTPHLNQSCVWSVYQTQYDPNDIHSMLYTEQGTEVGLMPCKRDMPFLEKIADITMSGRHVGNIPS
jgi:hypothetical protein